MFNPVIWLAYILLCRDVELACDEKVIKTLGTSERRDYSTALLNCSVSRVRIAACPIAFGEVAVKERIKGVMNYKKPAFWIIILAVIAVIVTAVCFLTDPKSKDGKKEDGVEEKEFIDEIVDITFKSYDADTQDVEIEHVSERLAATRPLIEFDFINNSEYNAELTSQYKLYIREGEEWTECPGRTDQKGFNTYSVVSKDSIRLIRNLEFFDLTKAGEYCRWQEYYFVDFSGEIVNKYARIYFELSQPIVDPIDEKDLTAADLTGYMYWLPQYLNMPYDNNQEVSVLNKLYLAARFSYENDMPFVEVAKNSFSISREDLCAMVYALTGNESDIGISLDGCHPYLEIYGDSYDAAEELYTFTLKRDGWGENEAVSEYHENYYLDPEKGIEIADDYNDTSVIAWITHPSNNDLPEKIYYKAEFIFGQVAVGGRLIYCLKDVNYLESPDEEKATEVSVTTTQQAPVDGYFTEFLLKVDDREKTFTGKAISGKNHAVPHITSISQNDLTRDGVYDISVIFRISEPSESENVGRYEIHVFDGVTLEEIPGLENVPEKVSEMLELSSDKNGYTVGINGKEYTVKKAWYEDYDVDSFYDLPDFTEDYQISFLTNGVYFYLRCVVCEVYRYDGVFVKMVYEDGKFVLDSFEPKGFLYYPEDPRICEVHSSAYHSFDTSFIEGGYESLEDWFRETDAFGYDDDGCKDLYNVLAFAKRFGFTEKDLRDQYYLSYNYYWAHPDPIPLFEMDEDGCDEFFRGVDFSENEVMKKRRAENEFKSELIESLRYSKDSAERIAFYKFTDNGSQNAVFAWNIPELVYEAELTLEELETFYNDFAEGKENVFEYDFERLFTEREYFEEQIETAEYPVLVDELLHK